jgi:virginiamycin B lyase
LALAAAVAGGGVLAAAAISGADPPTGTVTSYPLTPSASSPSGLTAGPDGNLWLVQPATRIDEIAKVTTAGVVTEYPITDDDGAPIPLAAIASGPSNGGELFFTEPFGDFAGLAEISTSGVVTQLYDELRDPIGGIATDSSGDVWVTQRVSQVGVVEIPPPYTAPHQTIALPDGTDPQSITAGADGQTMWVTEPGAHAVASVSQGGVVQQHSLAGINVTGTLGTIVLGPDGNLWVGVVPPPINDPSYLVRIIGSGPNVGTMTAFPLPSSSNADPDVLGSGPDGQLWMADGPSGNGDLTAVTTSGTFTDYPHILPAGDSITAIVRDPAGSDALYVTDSTANSVDRIPLQPPAPPPTQTTTPTTPSPPALTLAEVPASAITKTGATLSGTIAEPTGSASTSVTYQFQYGTTTAYGSSSPTSTATAAPSGTPVTASLSGLEPYTTYHYRLVASDCTAASCQAASADQSFTTGSTLQPVMSTAVGVAPTEGTILIKLRGHHTFTRLRAGELIPLGATIDARHGTILIQSSIGPGEVASGRFSSGIFTVTQPAGGTFTVLVLVSSLSVCPGHPHAQAALAHVAKSKPKKKKPKQSHKVVNQVFGNAHGQFSTQGNYATAADEGTAWQIADRCDGTQIAVLNGEVTVTNRITHRHFVLTAGHRHLIPR